MVRVVLHIGQHKTGSSSIQSSLFRADKKGTLNGYRYLNSPERNHSFVVSSAYGTEKSTSYYNSLKFEAGIPRRRFGKDAALAQIARGLESACHDDCALIISAEDLCGLM